MSGLTVKGRPISSTQTQIAQTLLSVGQGLGAPTVALVAVIYAGMGETSLGADSNTYQNNGAGFWGVLQGSVSTWPDPHDVKGQATSFFNGGRGFQSGGAIALAKSGVTNPAQIAIQVEVPSIWPADAYAKEWSGGQAQGVSEAQAIVQANGGGGLSGGGAFGAGGTGTPGNQTAASLWQVGDASNPDQDYWTTVNQYSMDAQWYSFSDGETLVIADGIQLMAQRPQAVIVRTDPRVVRAECTYDNNAFQYTSTHKKRGKIQRRTSLAKVTSPTEVLIRVICNVDQFRAGDTVWLKMFGPADGVWLIGDCVRDVFSPYTDLTLVQAMQPINAVTGAPTGPPFLTGPGASVPGSSTVIAAMISEASTLANDNYPYVYHGGHIAAGSPDVGKPGPGFDGRTKGFDCSGAVYAVLAAGGLWPEGSPVNSDISLLGGKVVPGQGTGTPECTLFYSPNDHEFMRINGQFWGTGDGSGNGATGNPNGGAGWLPNAVVAPRFQAYHFPQAILGQFTGGTAVGPGGYVNPFSQATGLVAERIDDGVDYAMSSGSPILAIGTVKVIEILPGWFAGQPLLLLQFLDGNKAGQYYYIAEQITGLPSVGTVVSAGSTLVTYASSGTGIEIGFGSPTSNSRTLAGQNGHGGMVPSPEGQQFSAFLVSLGAPGGT